MVGVDTYPMNSRSSGSNSPVSQSFPDGIRKRETLSSYAPRVPDQSLIEAWERAEDIQLYQPQVDLMDAWSSDGDSVSSSCSSSNSDSLLFEEPACYDQADKAKSKNNLSADHRAIVRSRKNLGLLRRARIYTSEEVIDQAIDRWEAYNRSCSHAMNLLKQQLIDAYIPYALEQYKGAKASPSSSSGAQNWTSLSALEKASARKRCALWHLLRHPVKVENQRHLSCVSKFAVVSSRLAKWRKPAASQQCRYRDPTTTTWEKPCSNLCLPLLAVCAHHLVLLKPAPQTQPESALKSSLSGAANGYDRNCVKTSSGSCMPVANSEALKSSSMPLTLTGDYRKSSVSASTNCLAVATVPCPQVHTSLNHYDDVKKAAVFRSGRFNGKGTGDPGVTSSTTTSAPALQIPSQYLFRRCGGGPDGSCSEPVVAWSSDSRCLLHTATSNYLGSRLPDWCRFVRPNPHLPPSALKLEEGQPCPPSTSNLSISILRILNPSQFLMVCTSTPSSEVFIVVAKRSPIGRISGCLSGLSAHQIGAQVISSVIDDLARRTEDPPTTRARVIQRLEEVIVGQVLTSSCGQNPARQAAVLAGIPYTVPSWGVSMVCGSGLKAICLGCDHLKVSASYSASGGWIIAGGQESMSQAPYATPAGTDRRRIRDQNSNGMKNLGDVPLIDSLMNEGLIDAFLKVRMGETAELLAQTYQVTREDQDSFALQSQRKCAVAQKAGWFDEEITPIRVPPAKPEDEPKIITVDEHPRPGTTLGALSQLKPVFVDNNETGTVTAGNCSGVNDGAAFVLLCRGDQVNVLGAIHPLARIVGWHQVGCEPELMGLTPVAAIRGLLSKVNWTLDSVDLFEINEAFAAQMIVVAKELSIPLDRLNTLGGAIALGHPLGCSGARILVTLVHAMHRLLSKTDQNQPCGKTVRGVAALCIGGGMGIAIALESCS
ncbi:unnamed protein product [Calicophoron daubneyi]|uniref:Acetyl-CoA acetyltransferase n=1 Tax=Calicophoron daubneyi TaxID=300641 RepID=A0AAV2SYT9_CALDB